MNKLFVGSLSWSTTDEGLRELFEQAGQVEEVKVISDRETGRSRGFGFVTFSNADDASSAMERFDNYELDGRSIKVSIAEDKRDRGPGRKNW
ncbi:MAG: RNA-binding protein [Zetaproteobacteria bacterium]|nr:RNA-binding protein [Zetaproteobacteria bacterium]